MKLSTSHLLGIKDLTKEDIELILSTAQQFKDVLQRPVKKFLRSETSPSLTFLRELHQDTYVFRTCRTPPFSRYTQFCRQHFFCRKGETLLDTVNNILSMKVDMVVMRHSASGAPHFLPNISLQPLSMLAMALMNIPHKACSMLFR